MKKGIFRFPVENGILECNCFFEIKMQEPICFVNIDLSNPSLEITNKIKELYKIHSATTNRINGYATYSMIKKNFHTIMYSYL
jgi:hypothetical protein